MTNTTKECEYCGDLFTPKRSTARFCKTSCRVNSNKGSTKESQRKANHVQTQLVMRLPVVLNTTHTNAGKPTPKPEPNDAIGTTSWTRTSVYGLLPLVSVLEPLKSCRAGTNPLLSKCVTLNAHSFMLME